MMSVSQQPTMESDVQLAELGQGDLELGQGDLVLGLS